MKLMMFKSAKGAALGVVDGDSVVDVAAADPSAPKTLLAVVEGGASALAAISSAAAKAPVSARHAN